MTVRNTSRTLARLLELLELEQPTVVSREDLEELARQAGVDWPFDVLVQRLRERGWLLDLKTRGVWEFAPAARAGAHGAGDPLIELRAALRRNPESPLAVAVESAAYLLGYASRRPAQEAVGVAPGVKPSPALRVYRLVRWSPRVPTLEREHLPVWNPSTLLAFMATRPAAYHDWPNVGEWLGLAAEEVDVDSLEQELAKEPRSAWARAAYLLDRGGQREKAAGLMAAAPEGGGPYYLGPRNRPGRYSKAYDVIDSTGLEVRAQ